MMKNSRRSIVPPKDRTCLAIEQMHADRAARRKETERRKKERQEEHKANVAAGNPGDVDFIGMVRKWRHANAADPSPYEPAFIGKSRLCVCVRKRPLNDKERNKYDHDAITCSNPSIYVHAAKTKVDGISKYLDHTPFCFDQAYGESVSTDEVYTYSTLPLLNHCCSGQGTRATVFCYGQTGSGKTYTMNGIQELLCDDLFSLLNDKGGCSIANTKVMVSFFEFYGGNAQDLLNDRRRLKLLENGNNEIVVVGLREVEASSAEHLKLLLEQGHEGRTTHQTEANDTSSRSHAICQICLKQRHKPNKLLGKISLVDLAGSERGDDTRSHNAQRRLESAEINTSLLCLKECIRALDQNNQSGRNGRVPYRGSKLTLLLKDCFTSPKALTTMIACISPGSFSADHSLNTLRYADRIKEKQARKTPQRSFSASSTPRRPLSLSPRRPVDATNHQHQPSSRRATLLNPKAGLPGKVNTRKTRSGVTTSVPGRITRSVSARMGLQHSNSMQTTSSIESRASYKSAPASSHIELRSTPSRSFSGNSSVEDDLETLLDDDFDVRNLSNDSGLVEPPIMTNSFSSDSRSETLFEPKPLHHSRSGDGKSNSDASDIIESQSDDSFFKEPDRVARPPDSGADEGSVVDQSKENLRGMFDAIHEQHMIMIQENADLLSREHSIQSEVDKAGDTIQAMDQYMLQLERILDHRENLIRRFRESVAKYNEAKSNHIA